MQKLKQIKLVDAIGKKIINVKVYFDKHIIQYEDGSFSFFEQWGNWDGAQNDNMFNYEEMLIGVNVQKDNSVHFTENQLILIDLGILDEKKFILDAEKYITKNIEKRENDERKLYEKLKEKFEK